jgi:hypothetical protein
MRFLRRLLRATSVAVRSVPLARTASVAIACAAVITAACTSAATDNPGTAATLQIPGAQFYPGPMPPGSPTGPQVAAIVVVNSFVRPGEVDYPISGAVGPAGTAAAVGLRGDVGYWILPAGLPNVAMPDDPSFAATAAFSSSIAAGAYSLVVQAVDTNGTFGAPSIETLTVQTGASIPAGDLVITLTWDTESDMDLHVVDAMGVEIYHDNMSDQPPPFAPQPEAGSYGHLDWDSNANCVIDGKREEDIIWPNPPPAGSYIVRVDAASLCGQVIAHWTVQVRLYGQLTAEAQGIALDADTRGPHGAGAGVTALQPDIP